MRRGLRHLGQLGNTDVVGRARRPARPLAARSVFNDVQTDLCEPSAPLMPAAEAPSAFLSQSINNKGRFDSARYGLSQPSPDHIFPPEVKPFCGENFEVAGNGKFCVYLTPLASDYADVPAGSFIVKIGYTLELFGDRSRPTSSGVVRTLCVPISTERMGPRHFCSVCRPVV